MKKFVSLLLVLIMVLSLAACGAKTEAPAPAPAPAETPAEAPAETPAEAPAEEPEAPAVNTVILMEKDDSMINNYSLIAVNAEAPFVDADNNPVPDVAPINTAGADAFIQWLLTQEAIDLAANFGFEQYGEYLFYAKDNAPIYTGEIAQATEETKLIRLSTTTSVNDSGLLGLLVPTFEEKYGYDVDIQSAGTGKAIAAAKAGNADLIFVHSKSQEEAFIEGKFGRVVEGFEAERITFLYNFYVLCGPTEDPAGVKDAESVKAAFKAIADGKFPFVSRGDKSGTHTKEISLWPEELGITAEAESFAAYTEWYTSANAGMGACLVMAKEMGAYILTDKATFLTFYANGGVIA